MKVRSTPVSDYTSCVQAAAASVRQTDDFLPVVDADADGYTSDCDYFYSR